MIFDKPTFEKLLKGYKIIDCAIRNKNRQCFVLKKNSKIKFLFTYNDELEMKERYFFKEWSNFSQTSIAFKEQPIANYIGVELGCNVYSYDIEFDGLENKLPELIEGYKRAMVMNKAVAIQGTIYTVGYPNKMYKRVTKNQWEDITETIAIPKDLEDAFGFKYFWKDADGFSENDIYTVGGQGEVWHYDGKHWKQIPFVNDLWLNNVCCAPDGKVYVGGHGSSLYVWNKKEWKEIKSSTGIDSFKDIKWFKGKLYCGEESRLRVLENDELVTVGTPFPQGSIDISPNGDYMLVAGEQKAHLFDGEKWEVLIDPFAV
jgi:hypothetical protein